MTDNDNASSAARTAGRRARFAEEKERLFHAGRALLRSPASWPAASRSARSALAASRSPPGWTILAGSTASHLAFIQGAVARALDSVGASAAQEAKIHDIVAAKFAEIAPDPGQHEAMRKQALDLLAAPTIDRAAVEKMRADAVAGFDAKSKQVVGAVLDIADQLTPAQRIALTARIGEMAQHGPMGPWGGWRHRPMDDGPDGAPDSGPDKN